ncbi:MAG TPA: hypothetical protein VGF76_05240 [Polyangiaceae bacterium]
MGGAEISLSQQTIVDGAKRSQILGVRGSATSPRLLVVKLKKRARGTAASVVAHVSAVQAIAGCDLALDGVRDVLAM